MEEKNQKLKKVVFDVVICLLQAKDARREEGFVFIQGHFIHTVPRKEPKLEKIFHNHHHLQRERGAEQKQLSGKEENR